MVGLGKEIVGLVMKPVAGTLDLVTLTARGLTNTPSTIYINLSNVLRKKKRLPRNFVPVTPYVKSISEAKESLGLPLLAQSEEYNLYLDEEELRRQIIEGFQKIEEIKERNEDCSVTEYFPEVIKEEIRKRLERQQMAKQAKSYTIKKISREFKERLEESLKTINDNVQFDISVTEKKGSKSIVGYLEMEYDGITSPDVEIINEELEEKIRTLPSIDEFEEADFQHFYNATKELEVQCEIVTLGLGEDDKMHLDEDAYSAPDCSLVRSRFNSITQGSDNSCIAGSPSKFKKNPVHKAPPKMHSHSLKNPFERSFTQKEGDRISELLRKEHQEELIRSRLINYQSITGSLQLEEQKEQKKSAFIPSPKRPKKKPVKKEQEQTTEK